MQKQTTGMKVWIACVFHNARFQGASNSAPGLKTLGEPRFASLSLRGSPQITAKFAERQ